MATGRQIDFMQNLIKDQCLQFGWRVVHPGHAQRSLLLVSGVANDSITPAQPGRPGPA